LFKKYIIVYNGMKTPLSWSCDCSKKTDLPQNSFQKNETSQEWHRQEGWSRK